MTRPRSTLRLLIVTIVACQVTGCTSWRVQRITPQEVIAMHRPPMAWVTRANRWTFLLHAPAVRNDSLVGWNQGAGMVAMPLAEVTQMSVRRPDGTKTAGLVVGIVVGVGLAVFLVIRAALTDPAY